MRRAMLILALIASPALAKPIDQLPVYQTATSTRSVTEIADCIVTRLTNADRPVIRTGDATATRIVVRSHVAATFQFDLVAAGSGTQIDIRRRGSFANGLKRAKACF